MKSKDELLAVVGPTASGKTKLGLQLAQEQKGEIISVDSRQVYRYLSIGTAKPRGQWAVNRAPCTETSDHGSRSTVHESLYLFEGVPYHLVDFLDPDQRFSAADFVKLATEKVHDIQQRGKTPILVGGTGLYFKALTEGLASLPQASPELRARLKKEAQEKGREFLHQKLQAIDPEAAKKIPAHNIQRLIRALEVYELTGKPISHWHQGHEQ